MSFSQRRDAARPTVVCRAQDWTQTRKRFATTSSTSPTPGTSVCSRPLPHKSPTHTDTKQTPQHRQDPWPRAPTLLSGHGIAQRVRGSVNSVPSLRFVGRLPRAPQGGREVCRAAKGVRPTVTHGRLHARTPGGAEGCYCRRELRLILCRYGGSLMRTFFLIIHKFWPLCYNKFVIGGELISRLKTDVSVLTIFSSLYPFRWYQACIRKFSYLCIVMQSQICRRPTLFYN